MAWKKVSELETSDALKFLITGIDAVDSDRLLALSTTNGRTRNARRWFVHRYLIPSGRLDWDAGKVTFRAWTLQEAMQRLSEPRILQRIEKTFQQTPVNSELARQQPASTRQTGE